MSRQDISDLKVEQYILGELPLEESARIDELRVQDPQLEERITELQKDNEIFFKEHPAELFIQRIRKEASAGAGAGTDKISPDRASRRIEQLLKGLNLRNSLSLAAAALVIALVFVYTPFTGNRVSDVPRSADEGIRLKGGAALMIYRKGEGGADLLGDGASVQPGDQLQIYYRSSGYTYGAILSLDGNGVVTQHFPGSGSRAAELDDDAKVMLSSSYILDDAPDFEKFYFFTSQNPFGIDEVKKAIKDAGNLKDPDIDTDKISYSVYTLIK